MIRRVLLGVILASMVSTPICAMQAMRCAASVGARAVRSVRSVQPAVVRQMPRVPYINVSQSPSFSKKGFKQESHGSWEKWAKGLGVGLGVGFGAIKKTYTEEDFIDFTKLNTYSYKTLEIAMTHFLTFEEEKQKAIVTTIMQKEEYLSWNDQFFIQKVYKEATEAVKSVIKDCIDLTKLHTYSEDIVEIAAARFLTFEEEKQKAIVTTIMQKEALSWNDPLFIKKICKEGTEAVKKTIKGFIDFTHLDDYGYEMIYVSVYLFLALPEKEQKEIIATIMQKEELSWNNRFFMEEVYKGATQAVKSVIQSPVPFLQNGQTPTHIAAQNYFNRIQLYLSLPYALRNLVDSLVEYQNREMDKNQVVVFNGQSNIRGLYAEIAKKLYENKHNVTLNKNSTMVRYFKKATLNEEDRKKICAEGPTDIDKQRGSLVFGNIDVLGNATRRGSCTIKYILDNDDRGYGTSDAIIDTIFQEYGFKKEFEQIKQDNPNVIYQLKELQKKISEYGILISFSFPRVIDDSLHRHVHKITEDYGDFEIADLYPPVVDSYVYPAMSGGYYKQYSDMSTVSDILNNMHRMPSDHEYCMPAGRAMADPLAAKAEGIKIKEWYVEPNLEIMKQRDALIDEIIAKCVAMKASKA